jgi:hypothetical protein
MIWALPMIDTAKRGGYPRPFFDDPEDLIDGTGKTTG